MTVYYILVFCGLAAAEFVRIRGNKRTLTVWCLLCAAAGALWAVWLAGVNFSA
ncbi:MAG: hypothetical protein PUA83_04085 [Clostridiales bacterium]|nr:hypothetical protein [Clostridiales bacterium]